MSNGTNAEEVGKVFLTKAQLLQGKRAIHYLETEEEGTFAYRPLTDGEVHECDARSCKGVKASMPDGAKKGKVQKTDADGNPVLKKNGLPLMVDAEPDLEMDMQVVMTNDAEVEFMILAAGLSIDKHNKYSPKEVRGLSWKNKENRKLLLAAIREVSGMPAPRDRNPDNPDEEVDNEVESFPED
ncbi:MAG: hypothetical protein GY841_20115 [FCB group bacterium]|nr:hypothetical protein [FCB group bacterium]